MKELHSMSFTLKMDREIDKNKHYISPGGYECNGKFFDFNHYEGTILKDRPDCVRCDVTDYDGTLGEDDTGTIVTPRDIKKGFEEFYVYTGEADEPEINPVEVTDFEFEFYDTVKDEYTTYAPSAEEAKKIIGSSLCA